MLDALIQRWQLMAARERRLVIGAAAVIIMAVVYLLLFEPAWLGRQRLERELPVLRSQLARVDQLATEGRRLETSTRASEAPQVVRARLEQSIDGAGLRAALTQFNVNGSLFDLRFSGAASQPWLQWLDLAVRDTRVRVVDASVARESTPGLISARVSLELPGEAGR